MFKRSCAVLLCAVCAMIPAGTLPVSAAETEKELVSFFSLKKTVLHEEPDGTYTLMQGDTGRASLLSLDPAARTLSAVGTAELPLNTYGGMFAGADYDFVLTGSANPEEDDSAQVLCLRKYSKSFELLGECCMYGDNTIVPFDYGSVSMAEHDGKLYLHTCHTMYTTEDGLNHQANLSYIIDEENMTIIDQLSEIWHPEQSSYVSHSFAQLVASDDDGTYLVDLGDAYPRALTLVKLDGDSFGYPSFRSTLTDIIGEIGDNSTGVTAGHMLLTDSCVWTAFASIRQESGRSLNGQKNLYLASTDKLTGETVTRQLTDYETGADVYFNPDMFPLKTQYGSLLLWTELRMEEQGARHTEMWCMQLTDTGEPAGAAQKLADKSLTSSPIACSDGMIRFAERQNSTSIRLYEIDPRNPVLRSVQYSAEPAERVRGDLNGDGAVTAADAVLLMRFISEDTAGAAVPADAADLNQDGVVTLSDVRVLVRSIT